MPRPAFNTKRSATLTAPSSSSLADALGFSTPNFQEVSHAPACSAAPEPENNSDDGLSEDGDDSHHRDILLSRQQDLQTAVAPVSCTTIHETSDDVASDDESVRTRPASAVPTAATELVEPSSTPSASTAKKVVATEYTEDDWDRPLGQATMTENNWYEYPQRREEEAPCAHNAGEEDRYDPDCDSDECIAMFHNRFQHDTELWSFGKRAQEQQYNHMMRLRQEQETRSRRHAASFVTHHHDDHHHHDHHHHDHHHHHQHHHHDHHHHDHHHHDHHHDHHHHQHHHQHVERAPIKHEEQRKAMLAIHPRGARGGNPNSTVACCYFKQYGYCKMGPDCWYNHDLDDDAPCHYGEKCKAGHACLAKKSSTQKGGKKVASSASAIQKSLPISTQPSALVPSDEPCRLCGAYAVMTQRFPVFNGHSRSMATRAHCTQCLNTYSQ